MNILLELGKFGNKEDFTHTRIFGNGWLIMSSGLMRYGDVKWEVNISQILLIFLTKYQSLVFHIVSSSMQQISNVYIYIYINILSAFRWYAFALVSMYHIDGLIQDSSNIIANALELQLSCARPPICNARNRSYSICSTSPCAGNVFIWDGFGIFLFGFMFAV